MSSNIKTELLSLVAEIDNEEILAKTKEFLSLQLVVAKGNVLSSLSEADLHEINQGYEEAQDESLHVPHDEVMKKYKEWL
jgi:hypothetical protein